MRFSTTSPLSRQLHLYTSNTLRKNNMGFKIDYTSIRYRYIGILFLCVLIVNMLYTASARAAFNTVAGTVEPNELGQLLIAFTGADGKPEEREFSVHYSGPNNKIKNTVFIGRTGHPASLVIGTYDVKIPVHPTLWIRDVVIESGKTTDWAVGGYGRIHINRNDSTGKPLGNDFDVYTYDDKKDLVIHGITNEPSEYILAGTYDIVVETKPRMGQAPVRVEAGRNTVLDLPQSGRLEVRGNNALGKPLKVNKAFIYKSGERESPFVHGRVNSPVELQPGTYDVRVDLIPEVWFEGIEISSGRERVIDIPELGRLMARGTDTEGVPLNGYGYSVYEPGNSEKEIAAGDVNVARDLLPGVYDVKVDLNPEAWFKGIEISAGSVKVIEVPPPAKAEDSYKSPPTKAEDSGEPPGAGAIPYEQSRIQILGKNAKGNPLESYYKFYVYAPGDKEKSIVEESVSNPVDMQPGVYDVRVGFMPDIWFELVEVVAGHSKVLELPLPGRLNVQRRDALGDSYGSATDFTVYVSGDREKPLLNQRVNWYKDLPAGVYDIQVNLNPEFWFEGIEITAGKSRVISLPALGRLEIRGKNAMGASRDAPFSVYKGGERETPVTNGVVNTPLEIQPGVYDIKVVLETDETWFNGVEIVSRQNKILELSQPGRIWIYGKDEAGEPLSVAFTVYADGEKETIVGRLDETVDLPAGTYDVKIGLEPEVWYKGIKIVGGQIRIIDLSRPPEAEVPDKTVTPEEKVDVARVGYAKLTAVPKEGAEPYKERCAWYVYPVGADGKPAEKYIDFSDNNPSSIFTLPPGHYLATIDVGEGSAKTEFEVKVAETTEKTVVIGVGYAKLTAVSKEGADPYDAGVWWYVYPVGDDGKPSEKYIDTSSYNPSGIFTLPPGHYLATINVGQESSQVEFDVKLGETTEKVVVVGVGYARLTAVPKEGADPYDTGVWWYVYPVGADGKSAEQYIDFNDYNPSSVFTLPPGRYHATVNIGKGSAETEFDVNVAETTEKSVVIGVGYAKLTAVPKEGADPYDTGAWWYVYPVGADGKPAEKYIDYSDYNPSKQFILPPGRYQAVLTIRKGRAEIEFEVNTDKMTAKAVVVNADAKAELKLDKSRFIPGEEIVAHFIATADFDSFAWAGIIPSNTEHGDEDHNDQYDTDYEYLDGQPSGSISLTAPQDPGQYDVRMHDSNVSGREVASVSFTVVAGASVEAKEQVQEEEQEKVQDAGQEVEQKSGQVKEETGIIYINATFRIAVDSHPGWEMKLMPGSRIPDIKAPPEQGGKSAFIDSEPRRGSQVLFLKKPSYGEKPSGGFNSNILLAVHDITKSKDETSAEAWIQNELAYTRKNFSTTEITVPPSQKDLNGKAWINFELNIESTVGEMKLELKQMTYVHMREGGGRRYIYVFAATALQSEFEADRQAMEAIIHSADLFE
jgi:hypothetical protein